LMNRFSSDRNAPANHARLPCPKSVKNGFDEQPIIFRRAAHVSFTSRQKILSPIPLIVA
jgi:hypothetical protein